MIYTTPRNTKRSDNLDLSTTFSKISRRINTETHNQSILLPSNSNKSLQHHKFIKTLSISVEKKKVQKPKVTKYAPRSPHPLKYKVSTFSFYTDIQTKQSIQSYHNVLAYGVSCFKGFRNVLNPHHITVNMGNVKNFNLIEAYDGSMAGNYIKKYFPLKLLSLSSDQIHNRPQLYLQQANEQVQTALINAQVKERDNSGCTLISAVIDSNFLTVSNCGTSQILCQTKAGSLLKLNEQHNTKNQVELDRIIENGGIIYKTVVNVPYEKDLAVEGPLRLSPSGLCFTRTLGKGLDYEEEQKNSNYGSKITWKPQIAFIKTSEIKWFGIFSQSVLDTLSKDWIRGLVNQQLKRRNQTYTEHHIAGDCSRKIVAEATNKGLPDAVTAIIVIVGKQHQPYEVPYQTLKNEYQAKQGEKLKKQKSLKYIGNRRSFVKEEKRK